MKFGLCGPFADGGGLFTGAQNNAECKEGERNSYQAKRRQRLAQKNDGEDQRHNGVQFTTGPATLASIASVDL